MGTFLTIVAGIVVGVLVFLMIAVWWIKRKFGGVIGNLLMQLSRISPMRITLQSLEVSDFSNARGLESASENFQALGYEQVGDFIVPEIPDVRLRGFIHPEENVYAVVYDHPHAGLFADVVQDTDDGRHFTVNCGPNTGLERPPNAPLIRLEIDITKPGSAPQLHERLLAEVGKSTVNRVTIQGFADRFVSAYAAEMDWRIERGGITEEEIRRVAEIDGQAPPSAQTIETIKGMWTTQINEFVEQEAIKVWLEGASFSAAEWEAKRDRVIVVNEQNDKSDRIEELAYHMVAATVDENDDDTWELERQGAEERVRSLFDQRSIRAAFLAAQSLLPAGVRFERIGQVETPCPSDIYLRPFED